MVIFKITMIFYLNLFVGFISLAKDCRFFRGWVAYKLPNLLCASFSGRKSIFGLLNIKNINIKLCQFETKKVCST